MPHSDFILLTYIDSHDLLNGFHVLFCPEDQEFAESYYFPFRKKWNGLSNMVNFYCGVYYSEYVMVNMYALTAELQYQEYKCPKEKLSNKIKSFKMFCLTCFVMLGWNLEARLCKRTTIIRFC